MTSTAEVLRDTFSTTLPAFLPRLFASAGGGVTDTQVVHRQSGPEHHDDIILLPPKHTHTVLYASNHFVHSSSPLKPPPPHPHTHTDAQNQRSSGSNQNNLRRPELSTQHTSHTLYTRNAATISHPRKMDGPFDKMMKVCCSIPLNPT